MPGWYIRVYRKAVDESVLATADSAPGPLMAEWNAKMAGPDWLDALVAEGRAVALGANGYPCRYTARAADLIPTLLAGPPEALAWPAETEAFADSEWSGRTRFDRDALVGCRPDEWLVVAAWDKS